MQEDPVLNAPIRSLQLMLRALSFVYPELPEVIPDGIFGDSTEAAVRAFQQKFGLPVTGAADLDTFTAIAGAYDQAMPLLLPPASPVVLFPAGLVIGPGQSHSHVYLAQAMLSALSPVFQEFLFTPLTGRMDEITMENLRLLQSAAGLPENGELDHQTYDRLARLYRANFDRAQMPSNG